MPWVPVFRGPLPPALAANSLRAFSSAKCQSAFCASTGHGGFFGSRATGGGARTSPLLLEESQVVLVEVFVLLLRGL